MMIEPTESEARETLDEFIEAMKGIAEQVKTDPAAIHAAPVTTPVGRPDEVTAARKPIVKYEDGPDVNTPGYRAKITMEMLREIADTVDYSKLEG